MFITNLLSMCVFIIIYWCFIWKYVMIFQNVVWVFEVLKRKGFFLPEDNNRIDSLGVLGVGWWVLMVWV